MNRIKIFDTTLRDGEQSPGCSMSIDDKVVIAKKLDDMKVDVIEAGFAFSSENDFNAIKKISKEVKNSTVASLARCNKSDIDKAWEAVKDAKHPRIHIFIGTSDIHIFDKLKKTKEEVLNIVCDMVSYAKSKCNDIEFSLEDATRTDKDYVCKIIDIAIKEGATTINIPDTVGYIEPTEFRDFIKYLKENSNLSKVDISVHCHNDLGNATANTMSAVKEGINQVECTVNGIGERAGNTAMEEVIANIDTRSDFYNCYTNVNMSKIYDISLLVREITGSVVQNNKPVVGSNAFKHEAGIHQAGVINNKNTYEIMKPEKYGIYVDNLVIGIHSGKNAIIKKINDIGYNPEDYDVESIINEVKHWFTTNISKNISNEELMYIIDNNKNIVKNFVK